MQSMFLEACLRAHPPLSSLDPLQGELSPDVTDIINGDAGSLDAVAEGGHSTNLHSQSYSINHPNNKPNQHCNICKYETSCCYHSQCKLCDMFDNNHYFESTNTGRQYHFSGDTHLSCNTGNIIYLITCNFCKLQYVGETSKT